VAGDDLRFATLHVITAADYGCAWDSRTAEEGVVTLHCRLSVLLAICLVIGSYGAEPEKHFDGKTWWSYVKVLADDDMEGRETGSEGLRKAEAYVVEQLTRDGLQPAGTSGFYQPVKFVARQIIEKDSSIVLVHDGREEPVTLGDDAHFSLRVDLAPAVDAPDTG
jgi:hypothetical protein